MEIIKSSQGEDTKRVIRNFELNNPGLTALYERQQAEGTEKMWQTMTIDDRIKHLKKIAELNRNSTFAERAQSNANERKTAAIIDSYRR